MKSRYDDPENLKNDTAQWQTIFGSENVHPISDPNMRSRSKPGITFPDRDKAEVFMQEAGFLLAQAWNGAHPSEPPKEVDRFLMVGRPAAESGATVTGVMAQGPEAIEKEVVSLMAKAPEAYVKLFNDVINEKIRIIRHPHPETFIQITLDQSYLHTPIFHAPTPEEAADMAEKANVFAHKFLQRHSIPNKPELLVVSDGTAIRIPDGVEPRLTAKLRHMISTNRSMHSAMGLDKTIDLPESTKGQGK